MSSNNKEMSLIGIEGNDAAEDEDLADNMEYPVRIPHYLVRIT